ncbi:hypothetical protein GINT2_001198 [Glugoides intestinalis]
MRILPILVSTIPFSPFVTCYAVSEEPQERKAVTFLDEKKADTPFALKDPKAIINCFITKRSEEADKPAKKGIFSLIKRIIKTTAVFKMHSNTVSAKDVVRVDKTNRPLFNALVHVFEMCVSFLSHENVKHIEINPNVPFSRDHPLYSLTSAIFKFRKDFKEAEFNADNVRPWKQKAYFIAYWIVMYLKSLDAAISPDYQLVLNA